MQNQKPDIVFIHGLFMTPLSWKNWTEYFSQQGYICHTPAYPYHEGNPEKLRLRPDEALGKLTFQQVYDSMAAFIGQLDHQPILIGHSMGGLLVQKLIDNQLGICGVLLAPAPPKGVNTLKGSFLRSNFPVVNPLKGNSIFFPKEKWFHYTFGNHTSRAESDKIFEKFAVPESRNIPRGSRKKEGKIDFKSAHAPLLFIGGEIDNIIPWQVVEKNYRSYKDVNSKRDFKRFEGRSHFMAGQSNWEEVADYVQEWIGTLPSE